VAEALKLEQEPVESFTRGGMETMKEIIKNWGERGHGKKARRSIRTVLKKVAGK
jgi:hypothetical protein